MSIMLLDKKDLTILEGFSSDYRKSIYGRQIAKELGMNQKTVSNILNNLEKKHIVIFSYDGRNKYYRLNPLYLHIKEIIKLIEVNKKIKFLEKYKRIGSLFDEIEKKGEGIVIVFGSYASEKASEKS